MLLVDCEPVHHLGNKIIVKVVLSHTSPCAVSSGNYSIPVIISIIFLYIYSASSGPLLLRGAPDYMNHCHDTQDVTGMKLAELRDVTTERKQWRRLAMMVAIVPRTDNRG